MLNSELRQDIVNHFEKLVSEMPARNQRKKNTILGMSPLRMLKHLKEGTAIGDRFVDQMVNAAFRSSNKEIGLLGLAVTKDLKGGSALN
jgi:hypothetical protein